MEYSTTELPRKLGALDLDNFTRNHLCGATSLREKKTPMIVVQHLVSRREAFVAIPDNVEISRGIKPDFFYNTL